MAASQNVPQPSSRTLRQLSWILAGCLALCGHWLSPSPTALWLQLAGAAIFAVGTVRPSALRPIYHGIAYLLRPVSLLASWIARARGNRGPTSSPVQ